MDRGLTMESNRIEPWQLRPSDHIYAPRKSAGEIYAHHGIYESDEKVIQLTSPSFGFTSFSGFSSSSSSSGFQTCNKKCHEAMSGGGVVICCLNCFRQGVDDICLFVYSVSEQFYKMNCTGFQDTCSMEDEDPPEAVLCRANDLYVNGGIRSYYSLFDNNCFHFAFFCKTGRSYHSPIEELLFRKAKEEHYKKWCFT